MAPKRAEGVLVDNLILPKRGFIRTVAKGKRHDRQRKLTCDPDKSR